MNLTRNLFDFERETTPGEVLFFRIFEGFILFATIEMAWTWGLYARRISEVVSPLGMAIYIDMSVFYGNALPLVNAGLITGLVVVGFFRFWRWGYLLALVLMHFQFVMRYTLGANPHGSNLVGMTLLALGLAMLVFKDARLQRRFTLGMTYFFVGLAYTSAGLCKLIGTGLSWVDGRHLWLWINEKGIDRLAGTGVLDFNLVQEIALSSSVLATGFLIVGLLTELTAFLMWWRRLRTVIVLAVIGLHIGIYTTMNIRSTYMMIELMFLALPWAAWLDVLIRRFGAGSWVRRLTGSEPRYA